MLTAVGLLPIAVAGIDIDALMAGAAEAMDRPVPLTEYGQPRLAVCRRPARPVPERARRSSCWPAMSPAFRFMREWWKQLYGESEGKEGKGLFPASVEFTADLHSMGQYIQEGERLMFETVVRFDQPQRPAGHPGEDAGQRGRAELPGRARTWHFVGRAGHAGHAAGPRGRRRAQRAHRGHRPPPARQPGPADLLLRVWPAACRGYLLGVNPFDQPGVEAYKKNMFALLGKPGYDDLRADLLEAPGRSS